MAIHTISIPKFFENRARLSSCLMERCPGEEFAFEETENESVKYIATRELHDFGLADRQGNRAPAFRNQKVVKALEECENSHG